MLFFRFSFIHPFFPAVPLCRLHPLASHRNIYSPVSHRCGSLFLQLDLLHTSHSPADLYEWHTGIQHTAGSNALLGETKVCFCLANKSRQAMMKENFFPDRTGFSQLCRTWAVLSWLCWAAKLLITYEKPASTRQSSSGSPSLWLVTSI